MRGRRPPDWHPVPRGLTAGGASLTLGALLGILLSMGGLAPTRAVEAASAPGSVYTALRPRRLLDTRQTGTGLEEGGTLNLPVAGLDGVPADATAVVLNVTVTDTTAPSYLTVYPEGGSMPLASNLNWTGGETRANLVVVGVGAGGGISFYNAAGHTDLVVDLQGYFAVPTAAGPGEYVALTPQRIADTRTGSGEPYAGNTLGPGGSLDIQVAGAGGVPIAGVAAVIMNVTATDTTSPSYLSVYPAGTAFPGTSNLNWNSGWTVANRVLVPLGSGGQVTVYNDQGRADVVVDVEGYITSGTAAPATAALFYPLSPTRVLDTRVDAGTLGAGASISERLAGLSGVAGTATSVVANLTATDTTQNSFFTLSPTPGPPTTSDLNWPAGATLANLDFATLGPSGDLSLYNDLGSADAVIDVFGYFEPAATLSAPAGPGPCTEATLSAPATATIGTTLPLTPGASCPAGTTAQFTYWMRAPGATSFTMVEPMSELPTFEVDTSGMAPGIYQFLMWASSEGEVYQQTLAQAAVLVEPPPCTSVSLSASPQPGLVSAPMVLTATPQCPAGETAWMQYFYSPSGSTAAPIPASGGWTTSPTLLVPTTGWAAGAYTFTVQLSSIDLGAPQQQAQASDTLQASGSIVVPNVPYSPQYYRMDCEEAVLEMELAHRGITLQGNNVQSQNDILGAEGVDQNVPGIGPSYTSGDPMQNFIGPPNGLESTGYEPGAYYGAVAKAAAHFGATVLAAGENISPQQVYAWVEEGYPVQAWVTFDFQPYQAVTLSNGRDSWPWAGPHEHSVLVIGVGVDSVLIDNPWAQADYGAQYPGADQWVPMSTFQAAYATYFDMALVLN